MDAIKIAAALVSYDAANAEYQKAADARNVTMKPLVAWFEPIIEAMGHDRVQDITHIEVGPDYYAVYYDAWQYEASGFEENCATVPFDIAHDPVPLGLIADRKAEKLRAQMRERDAVQRNKDEAEYQRLRKLFGDKETS